MRQSSIIHYLGVVAPMLLNQPKTPIEKSTRSNLALEQELNQVYMRFLKITSVSSCRDLGMTEMVRVLAANTEPRKREPEQ